MATQCHHFNNVVVLVYPMLYTKFQGHQPLGSEEGDFLKCFYHIWAWKPFLDMWPGTSEQIFIPTSHGGSIWNLASNGFVFFRKRSLKMFKSEWSWIKVNEWPWPSVVINHHGLIYLIICTKFHLTCFNSFLENHS